MIYSRCGIAPSVPTSPKRKALKQNACYQLPGRLPSRLPFVTGCPTLFRPTQLLDDRVERERHGFDVLLLLGVLVNYKKPEAPPADAKDAVSLYI